MTDFLIPYTDTAAPGARLPATVREEVSAPKLDDAGYDIILLAGQSNMQGDSSGAVAPLVDVTDPRIYTFAATGANAAQIVQGADPLAHRGGSSVVGPGMSFARWYAGTIPGNRRVLLVPAAQNNTAFGSGTQRWDPKSSWSNDANNLYELAIAQTLAALAAAGSNARLAAILWVQGESDALAGATAAAYRTDLEYLIDGLRARLSAPNLPFVIGSMLPEFTAVNATRQAIAAVHAATPTRKAFTSYVLGPSAMQRGDDTHYSPVGMRELGKRFLAGLGAAKANAAPSAAVPANPPPSGAPTLSNTVQPAIVGQGNVGATLTATPGTWNQTPDSVTYQWKRGGTAISGATAQTYVVASADASTNLSVTVTATKAGYQNGSATSAVLAIAATAAYAADDFNRAASTTSLGLSSVGGYAWQPLVGTWGLDGTNAYDVNAGSTNHIAVLDDGYANGTLELVFKGSNLANNGLLFRATDTNNFLVILASGLLYKCEAGAFAQIGGSARTAAANDVYTVILNGSSISLKVNGAALGSTVTSAFNQAATKHGILAKNAGALFDSFAHTAAVA